jgi:DNA primase
MAGRFVIPIHSECGDLVAYAGRALERSEAKYKFPALFRKSLTLFNLHRAIKHGTKVVVVEGFFDCFKIHQAGFPCVVALMGSSLSNAQKQLLEHNFQQVALMLDGDKAGRLASSVIGARLINKLYVKVIQLPSDNQPDQLSTDQIRCFLCETDIP